MAQSAAEKVGPLAHSAADLVAPLAQSAADRVAPLAKAAADRVSPFATTAADRVAPLAQQAVDRVSPYAQQAYDFVGPYAHNAAERMGPLAASAKQRGAHLALDAVDAAQQKVQGDLLPKLTEALAAAAAAPAVVEATKRGKATIAAAKGELALPEPKKGSWAKRLAVVAVIGGVAVYAARKFLGSKDADWQAAKPASPYASPTTSSDPAPATSADEPSETAASNGRVEAVATDDDPGSGVSAHQAYEGANESGSGDDAGEVVGDLAGEPNDAVTEAVDPLDSGPEEAAVGEPEEPASTGELSDDTTDAFGASTDDGFVTEDAALADDDTSTEDDVLAEGDTVGADQAGASEDEEDDTDGGAAADSDPSKYDVEGAYVGTEPPEGFFIKGNERSMKYHVPESAGYARTIAEVWFNSEEAAQTAGFVRAQR